MLNLMYKLYRSCLNFFKQDHCESKKIVTDEQAGGKKSIWGCGEQLLINKTISKEVKKTITKFDNYLVRFHHYLVRLHSVSHSWLFTTLKVPENTAVSIEKMSKLWTTIATFKGTNQTIKIDTSLVIACQLYFLL